MFTATAFVQARQVLHKFDYGGKMYRISLNPGDTFHIIVRDKGLLLNLDHLSLYNCTFVLISITKLLGLKKLAPLKQLARLDFRLIQKLIIILSNN